MNDRYIRSKFVSCRSLIIISTFLLFLLSCSEFSPNDRALWNMKVRGLEIETLTIDEKVACESGFLKTYSEADLVPCSVWVKRIVSNGNTKKSIWKLNDPVYLKSMETYKYAKSNGFETYNDFVEKTNCDSYAPRGGTRFKLDKPKLIRVNTNKGYIQQMEPYCPVDEQIGNLFVAKTNGFDSCSAEWSTSYERCLENACSKGSYAPIWCKEGMVRKNKKDSDFTLWVFRAQFAPGNSPSYVTILEPLGGEYNTKADCNWKRSGYDSFKDTMFSAGYCAPTSLKKSQVERNLKKRYDFQRWADRANARWRNR